MNCSGLKIHVFYKSVSGTDISTMDLENKQCSQEHKGKRVPMAGNGWSRHPDERHR